MGAAWQLRNHADITLIEREARPGGHTNTVTVEENGHEIPIDTGFIVFNHATYPNLVRLFEELGVETKPSEMSFSVQHVPSGLEYNGMGLDKLFAQRGNILNPRFHALVFQILRFFRVARALLKKPDSLNCTVGKFVHRNALGVDFLNLYLIPMSSAVWSTDPRQMLDFPALSLIRFFQNHGFLGVTTHHPWFTVSGGSRSYRDKLLAHLRPVQLPAKAVEVKESETSATVRIEDGTVCEFDRVIIAAHADEALGMLAAPDEAQSRLLSAFGYQKNTATLHTDHSVMPRIRRAWASWNYRVEQDAHGNRKATTHYWMNALQGVSKTRDYFVSVNGADKIRPETILYQTGYEHPVYTLRAMEAQRELPALNTRSPRQRIFFCGSYFRHGFHEDAYSSAVDLAAVLRPLLGQ
ncbi:MAG: NADP transhydrogenase subunit alpha [Proteobacteria bacterium]|nr:NADP transhydrogenase subunit alpha [Pseudomonadota bacterium]